MSTSLCKLDKHACRFSHRRAPTKMSSFPLVLSLSLSPCLQERRRESEKFIRGHKKNMIFGRRCGEGRRMSRSFRGVNKDKSSTIKFVEIQLEFPLNTRAPPPRPPLTQQGKSDARRLWSDPRRYCFISRAANGRSTSSAEEVLRETLLFQKQVNRQLRKRSVAIFCFLGAEEGKVGGGGRVDSRCNRHFTPSSPLAYGRGV